MAKLIQHHIKYKEIHGVDEIKLMDFGEHKRLHNKLRREGRCNIPVDILNKISHSAHLRTPHCKEVAYKKTKSPEGYASRRRYSQKARKNIIFTETLLPRIVLYEHIRYNIQTGHIEVCSYFSGSNQYKIPTVSEPSISVKLNEVEAK